MFPVRATVGHAVDWIPDWRGQPCVIVGGGPSASSFDPNSVPSGVRVVAINRSYELTPRADMLYACDAKFWSLTARAREFPGIKVAAEHVSYNTVNRVHLVRERGAFSPRMHFDVQGDIGCGYSSGFQALNLVAQTGCSHILLVGFDATLAHGEHWHPAHEPPLTNPRESLCVAWRKALDSQAPALADRGVCVSNASAQSALEAYPKIPAEKWFREIP